MEYQEWIEQVGACLMDMGYDTYDETQAKDMYNKGYEPAEAAGWLVED